MGRNSAEWQELIDETEAFVERVRAVRSAGGEVEAKARALTVPDATSGEDNLKRALQMFVSGNAQLDELAREAQQPLSNWEANRDAQKVIEDREANKPSL